MLLSERERVYESATNRERELLSLYVHTPIAPHIILNKQHTVSLSLFMYNKMCEQKDRNALKKAMVKLKEKTLTDFTELSIRVNGFNVLHTQEMEKWKSAYQVLTFIHHLCT